MEPVESENYKGYTIEIYVDEDPINPRRKENDNFGIMACRHKRYDLGDEKASWETLKEAEKFFEDNKAVYLPLYLMDHSGLSMNTGGFRYCDPQGWDWGLVGWIYAPEGKIKKEYGVEEVTPEIIKRVEDCLTAEVEEYSCCLSGDVFGYVIKGPDIICPTCKHHQENGKDSCWGFFGLDVCLEAGKEAVDALVKTSK